MNSESKKLIIPVLMIVIVLIVLVMGATYAYFSFQYTTDMTSLKITTKIDSVGVVSLSAGKNLNLSITAHQMMQQSEDIEYYATISGTPVTTENNVVIATALVKGNGIMTCKYQLKATISGINNMYTAFEKMSTKSDGQLVLNIAGENYDLNKTTFPLLIDGTLTELKEGSPQDIMASFKVVNKKDFKQNDLAGTDLTISFIVNSFDCSMVG